VLSESIENTQLMMDSTRYIPPRTHNILVNQTGCSQQGIWNNCWNQHSCTSMTDMLLLGSIHNRILMDKEHNPPLLGTSQRYIGM